MATQLQGIGDFVRRLEKIAEDCGEKKASEDQPKDEFLRLKQRIYTLLEQARSDITDRQSLLKKRGNCYETIQKGHAVRQALDELKQAMPKLQTLHKKAQNKRGAKSRKEELQARYQDIRVLKRHVDELNELFLSGQDVESSYVTPRATLLGKAPGAGGGLRDSARANPDDARRDLTTDEEDALAAMKRRDAELDKQADEIGLVLNRLDPLARQIGVTADRQRLKAESLHGDVDQCEADLEALNKRVSEVIKYEKNTNCCCQIMLSVALLCCVGFVFQQLT
eukprot:TRINITY_DN16888_c0_g1_i1.p1 TRINITY_DN16888_c0_g1~~TRINITY_DN16888_c0_g1_i1.p1  ORF type:complete len:281 (+),score=86.79 TRINITY_DN16888_c0_g1_i1:41-883(+)